MHDSEISERTKETEKKEYHACNNATIIMLQHSQEEKNKKI